MDAWTNAWTSAGNGVLKSGLLTTGEMTPTLGTESDFSSTINLWRANQRGTKPMTSPMRTSKMTICKIRATRIGGGADEDEVVFMAWALIFLADVHGAGA